MKTSDMQDIILHVTSKGVVTHGLSLSFRASSKSIYLESNSYI